MRFLPPGRKPLDVLRLYLELKEGSTAEAKENEARGDERQEEGEDRDWDWEEGAEEEEKVWLVEVLPNTVTAPQQPVTTALHVSIRPFVYSSCVCELELDGGECVVTFVAGRLGRMFLWTVSPQECWKCKDLLVFDPEDTMVCQSSLRTWDTSVDREGQTTPLRLLLFWARHRIPCKS